MFAMFYACARLKTISTKMYHQECFDKFTLSFETLLFHNLHIILLSDLDKSQGWSKYVLDVQKEAWI